MSPLVLCVSEGGGGEEVKSSKLTEHEAQGCLNIGVSVLENHSQLCVDVKRSLTIKVM